MAPSCLKQLLSGFMLRPKALAAFPGYAAVLPCSNVFVKSTSSSA